MQKLSVVIPTLNRARLLASTIDQVETQTLPQDQYEVIVVDNNSHDETLRVLVEKAAEYPNLQFSSQSKPGAAATRNEGLRIASGEIILFIDDDIEADPNLLSAHLEYHHENPNLSVIGKIQTGWESTRDPFLRYLRDQGIFNSYSVAGQRMDFACYHTGNVSTPRDMLAEIGGFNEHFAVYGMEDIELGYRLKEMGYRMMYGENAVAIHHYFPSYEEFTDRCDQAGYSLGLMLRLHPELRDRFTENGTMTRLLKPFHRLYGVATPLVGTIGRTLERLDQKRGSGPVAGPLDFHYGWALRYNFFVGYSRYAANGHSREPVRVPAVEGLRVKKAPSKIESSSVARL